jgi:SAM-dependent methyltransferase
MVNSAGSCPLCGCEKRRPSWMGSIDYDGRAYVYEECLTCRSLYCDPMPDSDVLTRMYDTKYVGLHPDNGAISDPKEPLRVVRWLEQNGPGVFLDYGCGAGALLKSAASVGWEAIGLEFNPDAVRWTAERTGATVYARASLNSIPDASVDAIHLGDVIEHLTRPAEEIIAILRLLKPGGTLLAQGPLEASPNLFTLCLSASKKLRRNKSRVAAPYHVLLATIRGQLQFFDNLPLTQIEFDVREVAWPAPDSIGFQRAITDPRSATLYGIRRMSQIISSLNRGKWGNRYFYIGQLAYPSETNDG